MKHKKTMLSLIIAVFLILTITPGTVFAAWDQGDKGTAAFTTILIGKDKKEYYINEKASTLFYNQNGKRIIKAGHNRTKVRWRYFKFTNSTRKQSKFGYCVEFGADFMKNSAYKAKNSGKDTNFFQKMPSDVQRTIALILCYGRNGSNKVPVANTNDADYYFATQVLVWEAQQELRRIKTDSKGNPKGTALGAAHNMKATHMQNFLKNRPAKKCYDWIVKKVDDHLKVHSFTSEKKAAAPTHTLKKNSNNTWSLTLTDTNKKSNGIVSSNSKITVKKSGYNYTFTSKTPITTPLLISASNIITSGSSSKKILVWHCSTNASYQAIVTGSDDLSVEYLKLRTLADQPSDDTAEVRITKKDKETDKIIAKANTTYQIKEETTGTCLEEQIVTDKNGVALVKTKLSPGSYQLFELQAPEGYVLEKKPLKFVIKAEDEKLDLIQKDMSQKGMIRIHKTGETLDIKNNKVSFGEKPLAGVTFEIIADSDIITGDGTLRAKKDEVVNTIVTDFNGVAKSKKLYLGDYHIREKEGPRQYQLLSEHSKVSLNYEGQEIEITYTDLQVSNKLKKGKVVITKTDISTGKPLPNTGIEILDHQKKRLLKTRTDENGKAFFDVLPAGNYYFREFDAPVGYQIDERPFPFKIKGDGEIVKCKMTNQKLDQSSPRTGDDRFPLWLYLIVLVSAAVVLVVTGLLRKY